MYTPPTSQVFGITQEEKECCKENKCQGSLKFFEVINYNKFMFVSYIELTMERGREQGGEENTIVWAPQAAWCQPRNILATISSRRSYIQRNR